MPGIKHSQSNHSNNHNSIAQSFYYLENHNIFMFNPDCYLFFSSTMALVINTLTQAPDLMTLQIQYFPKLSDFGRDELFLRLIESDEDTEEAIEILTNMSQTTEEIAYADYPNVLFSPRKRAYDRITSAADDECDEDYLPKKRR